MFYCNQLVHGAKRAYSSDLEQSFHAMVNGWVERQPEIEFDFRCSRSVKMLFQRRCRCGGEAIAVSSPQAVRNLGIDRQAVLGG
jgi:hypothetical protein